jgi:hydrogenase maturation protease
MSKAAVSEPVEARWQPPLPQGSAPASRAAVCSPDAAGSLLVLGLGNDILTDDAIGLRLVRALAERLGPSDNAVALESEEMGLSLLDHIVGYDDLVIVDAIQTGTAPPGHLHQFDGEALPSRRTGAPHFLGVGDTLALGRLLGLPMPSRVRILAVEVADALTLGTALTPQLHAAFPRLLDRVTEAVRG